MNAYLREITGREITAKDFRTWAGTVLAALALQEFESFDTKARPRRTSRAAIEQVAARLGNTPTICRKCYVHPECFGYVEGQLLLQVKAEVEELRRTSRLPPEEAAVLTFCRAHPEGSSPTASRCSMAERGNESLRRKANAAEEGAETRLPPPPARRPPPQRAGPSRSEALACSGGSL